MIEGDAKVFKSIVISPNGKIRDQLVSALQTTGEVAIARTMDLYPTAIDLVRALRAHAVEVLFLDFGSIEKALEIVELLEQEASHVQIVAFHPTMDPVILQQSMRVGVREFLAQPFVRQVVM